jgi:hypothetical protein
MHIFSILSFKSFLIAAIFMAISTSGFSQKKELRHVVMFKFKETSSAADVKKVEDAFHGLKDKIKQINAYEWGTNNSPEGLDNGFTHIFFVTFNSEEDRAVYLPHPDHKAFVEVLKPHLDKDMVLDYWAKNK